MNYWSSRVSRLWWTGRHSLLSCPECSKKHSFSTLHLSQVTKLLTTSIPSLLVKKISTLWQVYSSSFEVWLVYFKVTFQLVGPDCLFWSAWILTYIEVNFLTFSVGVSVFSNFYWQRTSRILILSFLWPITSFTFVNTPPTPAEILEWQAAL